MEYRDHIIISVRTDMVGKFADTKKFEARYAEEDGPYQDLRGYGVHPYAAAAMLEHNQIADLLESQNLKGADSSE